jgi:undecaprenyl-diphosphatase
MSAKSASAFHSGFWFTALKVVFAVALLIGGFLLLRDASQLEDIVKALQDANGGWIIIGLITTALSYTMAGLTQYAAGSWQGSFHKVHMLQWAGNFINRFLPLNVGSTALVVRHYRRHGRAPAEALTVAALPSIVGFAKNIIPVLILSPFTIANILKQHPFALPPVWVTPAAIIILLTSFFLVRKYSKRIKQFGLEARGGLTSMKKPWQLAVLILASVAYTLLASTSLFAAAQAVGVSLPLADVFTMYILSVFAGSVIPTPGGIGGTEAALIAGLTSLGIDIPTAVSITLLFRLMTFWAPLIPGAIALHMFRKSAR